MITLEQLEMIKSIQNTCQSVVIIKYIDILLDDIERLTRDNERMRDVLNQFASGDNWTREEGSEFLLPSQTDGIARVWTGDDNPRAMAEGALQANIGT